MSKAFQTLKGHPSYGCLKLASELVPSQSAALIHTFTDLIAAQQWENVEVIKDEKLVQSKIVLLRGRAKSSEKERIVYPMALEKKTNFQQLSEVFKCLDQAQNLPKTALLAIVSTDSSIVYYELSDGIVSPKEAPES